MTSSNLEMARQALAYLPAKDYDLWLKIGMGLHAGLGDAGFQLYDDWSKSSSNYSAGETKTTWRSFKSTAPNGGRPIGLGTLIHEAKARGYKPNGEFKPHQPMPEEIAERERQLQAERDEFACRYQAAEQLASCVWKAAQDLRENDPHPYLARKGVEPTVTLKEIGLEPLKAIIGYHPSGKKGELRGRILIVPIKVNVRLSSLEMIDETGNKATLRGSQKSHGYWATGPLPEGDDIDQTLAIGEGVATVLTPDQVMNWVGVASFSNTNLGHVAGIIRQCYPKSSLVILADLDKKTGEPDRHAVEAARVVGAILAAPDFGPDRDPNHKDWNDLLASRGPEKVRRQFEAVLRAAALPESGGTTVKQVIPNDPQNDGVVTAVAPNLGKVAHPEPLPTLPPVLPFDFDYLPNGLRGFVKDISERMQCPPDFAAVAVFVMMSTLIGRKVGIRPMKHNDWTVIPNLWGAAVGNSGVMKSPALAEALAPIKKLQAAAYDVFNKAKVEHDTQAELAKLQQSIKKTKARASLKKDQSADVKDLLKFSETDDAPVLRRYITNNSSYEALGELLMENPYGLMVEADEIIGLLKQLDSSGQEVARSFYLTSADGDKSYVFDRIMRGKGLHIEALCLSIIGGIQPSVLAEYVRQATGGGAGADGLLQRFGLMVYPDVSPHWKEVDRYPDNTAREAVSLLAERLDNLTPADLGAEIDPYGGVPFLRFDDAAQVLFSEWRAILETRLRSGEEHPAMVSHLSKYRKLIPSLALINHLSGSRHGAVSEAALLRAIAFGEYLESHAQRIYSYATRPDIDAAKTLLKRLASGKLANPFKVRDVYRAGWAGLETPAKAQAAIELLVEYRHLHEVALETGGRPTSQFYLNEGPTA